MHPVNRLTVLLMEDDEGDVELTRIALSEVKVRHELHVVSDGAEGLRYLRREGEHADAPSPNLILLDLNMPGIDGYAVLRELRSDETLSRIPVVILSTSDCESDVVAAYGLGANAYMTKPVGLDDFVRSIRSVAEFWLVRARLPVFGF